MAIILSLETSTGICSVAIHDNGVLLGSAESLAPQSQASQLAVMASSVMHSSGVRPDQLDAVGITSGPGSYTGLRIGTSTAKGLCYALDIPLVAVSTLRLLASQAKQEYGTESSFFCPMIDARRMEVYSQVMDSGLHELTRVEAVVVNEDSFATFLSRGRVLFFGDGAAKCKGVVRHPNAVFIDGVIPLASHLGMLTAELFSVGQVEDVVHFEPFYLKDFIAKTPGSVF